MARGASSAPGHRSKVAYATARCLTPWTVRFFRYDPDAWRQMEPGDWSMWRRMRDAGVRMGMFEHVVYRHYKEARHRSTAA